MNANQKAKLLMVRGIIQYGDENPAIVSIIIALQTAFDALKAKVTEIDDTVQLVSASLTGIAADKVNLRQGLCELAADISGMIYAYATTTRNNTLKQEVNYSLTKLLKTRDAVIESVCRMIHEKAAENLDALKDYGISTALLAEFNTAIDDYAAANPKPRTAIGKRKTRTEILRQLFKELDEILNERMDKLVGGLRKSHPDFYETYFNLREIIDPSTTTTQLKGKITDKSDAAPIKNAIITVVELAITAKTNSAGEYSIKPIEQGKFTVKVTKDGYLDFEAEEIEVKLGDIKHLDMSLVKI